MKLITWNCHHGSMDERIKYLERFNADIICLQEVNAPTTKDPHIQWFGTNERKGHAVIVSNDYTIFPLQEENEDPFVVPLNIRGPVSFHLMIVWTQKKNGYIKEMQSPLRQYRNFLLEKQSVILGDFNSNMIWDKNHQSFNHGIMVDILSEIFNLKSAYHEFMECRQGCEIHPTFYLYHKQTSA